MHFHICMNSLLTFISRCDSMIIKQQSVCMRFFFRLCSYHSKQYDYCLVMVQIIKSFLKVIKCGNLWAIECVETCVASSNPTRARMPKFLTGCIPCTRGAALAATSIIRNFCFKFVRDSCTLFVKCYYRLNELLCLRRRSITHCPCMLMPQRDISTEAREIREISGMMGNVHYRSPLPLPPHNPSTLSDTRAFLVVAISISNVCCVHIGMPPIKWRFGEQHRMMMMLCTILDSEKTYCVEHSTCAKTHERRTTPIEMIDYY